MNQCCLIIVETIANSKWKTNMFDVDDMWVLAEPLGYVVKFDSYQGAKNGMSARAGEKT